MLNKKLKILLKTDYKKIAKTIKSIHDKKECGMGSKIMLYRATTRMITNFQNNLEFRLPFGHDISKRVDELIEYNNER